MVPLRSIFFSPARSKTGRDSVTVVKIRLSSSILVVTSVGSKIPESDPDSILQMCLLQNPMERSATKTPERKSALLSIVRLVRY